VQQDDTPSAPERCEICEDERQWVPAGGQRWTTLEELSAGGRHSDVREVEPDLLGIGADPGVAIGQRALVVRSGGEGLLWDLPGFIDEDAVERVRAFSDVTAIAASHPHFYGLMGEWSRALGGVPALIPEADSQWVQHRTTPVRTWSGRLEVLPGITLLQCGGHFAGSAVVHWAQGAEGRGVLLSGDTVAVASDVRYVSFMRSYPNVIPLGAPQVRHIAEVLSTVRFDRIYSGWWSSVLPRDGNAAVERSAERYLRWIGGGGEDA
jgi:hypothetical protein